MSTTSRSPWKWLMDELYAEWEAIKYACVLAGFLALAAGTLFLFYLAVRVIIYVAGVVL